MKMRIEFWDYLKGICIYLVVLGHCCRTIGDFYGYDNSGADIWLVRFIYSFHMPLFMFISGYFASHGKFRDVLKRKVSRLIIPILFWTCLKTALRINTVNSVNQLIKMFLIRFLTNYWFLWAIFAFNIIILILENIKIKNKYRILVLLCIGLVLIPDCFPSFSAYKFMLPYYVLGSWIKERDFIRNIKLWIEGSNKKNIVAIFNILFIVLLLFYKAQYIIDVTDIYIFRGNIIKYLYIDVYRWMIGAVGAVTVILNIYLIWGFLEQSSSVIKKIVLYCGRNSLGIYIIHYFIIDYGLIFVMKKIGIFSISLLIVFSIFVTIGTCILIYIIKKIKLGKIALGEF